MVAKCQNTKRPYLIKYKKLINPPKISELGLSTQSYRLVGGFQIDNNYFELSDSESANNRINSERLIGTLTCPCCGNQFGFAMCQCQKIHCIGQEEKNTCPWCGMERNYGFGSVD